MIILYILSVIDIGIDLEEQKVIDIGVKKSISSTPTKYMHVMAHGQDGATSASI